MHALVHAADIQDRDGGALVMATLFGAFPFLLKLYADGGYQGAEFRRAVDNVIADVNVEIVKRSDQSKGFLLLPRRWVVNRRIIANVHAFEWSTCVDRVDGRPCRLESQGEEGASRFVAHKLEPNGSLMRARRRVSTPEADGGMHGPAHASSSVASARIVRDDEVQPTTSDRSLRSPRADTTANLALDAGGGAAIDDAEDGDGIRG